MHTRWRRSTFWPLSLSGPSAPDLLRRYNTGWLFTSGQSRTDLIQRRIAPWANDGHKGEILKHSALGNVLWTVRRNTNLDGKSELWIGRYLMRSDRSYGWG